MALPRLASDVTKDKLTEWIANALKCELFPKEGDSLANVELPAIEAVNYRLASRSEGDDTHLIGLEMADGRRFSILVRYDGRE